MRMMTRKKKEENHMAPGWVKEFRAVTLNLQGLSLPSKVTPASHFVGKLDPNVMLILCQMLGYVKRPGRSGGRGKACMGLEVYDLGKREK